jgi:hypothetical protein
MHHRQNSNDVSNVPPGKYKYSQNLPGMMNQLSPEYNISAEPVFLDHLLLNVGKTIRVVTTTESLEGILSGATIDHLQLTIGDLHYHIRFQHIIYYVGKP